MCSRPLFNVQPAAVRPSTCYHDVCIEVLHLSLCMHLRCRMHMIVSEGDRKWPRFDCGMRRCSFMLRMCDLETSIMMQQQTWRARRFSLSFSRVLCHLASSKSKYSSVCAPPCAVQVANTSKMTPQYWLTAGERHTCGYHVLSLLVIVSRGNTMFSYCCRSYPR